MLPTVRKALGDAIRAKMQENGLTWADMPKAKVKQTWTNEKGESIPFGWGTLRKVANDMTYIMMPQKQIELLKHFEIPYTCNYGIVNLLNIPENEK